MAPEIVTPAFVLHARSYGESDRIVTFLTAAEGKVTGIAKGAKNSRRRFAGTLEPFVHVRLVFRPRPHADLVFLVRCELIEAYRRFTADLDRFAAGSYVLELTDRMVLGQELGGETYRLVRDALVALDAGAPVDPLLRAFELHLLALSGYAPSLDACRACGRPFAQAAAYLAVERGGLLCRGCVPAGLRVRPVAAATTVVLQQLASTPLAGAATMPDPSVLAEAAIVSELLLAAVNAVPLRSREFLARTRVDSTGTVR